MKIFKKVLCVNIIFFTSLMATSSPIIEAEVAVKLVNHKGVKFIAAEEDSLAIKGAVVMNVEALYGYTTTGVSLCPPFYACPNRVKKYMESLGINNDDELIVYDKSYGINAATLYSIFETVGHKNIKILNGGYAQIQKLDPNQKSYDEYSADLNKIKRLLKIEENVALIEKHKSDIKSLEKILLVLKPLLLIEAVKPLVINRSSYTINNKQFNVKYLVEKSALNQAVETLHKDRNESNITIVDSCNMIDIVGNRNGSYLPGVTSIHWKKLVDSKKQGLKSKELLAKIFENAGLNSQKSTYLYCMSGSEKSFYLQIALRLAGYDNVKVFAGNWDVWIGDEHE